MALLPARDARAVDAPSRYFPPARPRAVHNCDVFVMSHLTRRGREGIGGRGIALSRQRPVLRARTRRMESEVDAMPMSRPLALILPQRRRCVPASFAWFDRQLRAQRMLTCMTSDGIALYVFLVLAADRDGLSCWRLDRMERELPLEGAALVAARTRLIEAGLIAFRPWSARSRDGTYQVLSIEPRDSAPRRGGLATMRDILDSDEE
jgi:hypothetical protein